MSSLSATLCQAIPTWSGASSCPASCCWTPAASDPTPGCPLSLRFPSAILSTGSTQSATCSSSAPSSSCLSRLRAALASSTMTPSVPQFTPFLIAVFTACLMLIFTLLTFVSSPRRSPECTPAPAPSATLFTVAGTFLYVSTAGAKFTTAPHTSALFHSPNCYSAWQYPHTYASLAPTLSTPPQSAASSP